jgi:hypothetical protein
MGPFILNLKISKDPKPGTGPYCYDSGLHTYVISDLILAGDQLSSYSQLYISSSLANHIQSKWLKNVSLIHEPLQKVSEIFSINLYLILYKSDGNITVYETSANTSHKTDLWFVNHAGTNTHQYSRPTADETASVFISTNGAPLSHYYINVYGQQRGHKIIFSYSLHLWSYVSIIWTRLGQIGNVKWKETKKLVLNKTATVQHIKKSSFKKTFHMFTKWNNLSNSNLSINTLAWKLGDINHMQKSWWSVYRPNMSPTRLCSFSCSWT